MNGSDDTAIHVGQITKKLMFVLTVHFGNFKNGAPSMMS